MSTEAKTPAPDDSSEESLGSGRVTRDARGNAVWEWSVDIASTAVRLRQPRLSVTNDEAPAPTGAVKLKRTLAAAGFDPYETGLIEKVKRHSKPNLRELSRWIEMRKRCGENTEE